jgi:hypothetical protein
MKKIIFYKRFVVFLPLFLFVPTVPVAVGSNNILDSQTQNESLIYGTLVFVIIVTGLLLLTRRWNLSDVGLKPKDPTKGLSLTLALCIVGLSLAGPYARLLGFNETVNVSKVDWLGVIKWSVLYVFAQDFMYQGFLSKVGREIFSGKKGEMITDICVVILFIWMHSMFGRPVAVMTFVAPGAVIFKLLYNKYENVYLVSLLHTPYSLIAFYHVVFHY